MPNITGTYQAYTYKKGYPTGVFTSSLARQNAVQAGTAADYNFVKFTFGASYNSIYNNSDTVTPESLTTFMLIKY